MATDGYGTKLQVATLGTAYTATSGWVDVLPQATEIKPGTAPTPKVKTSTLTGGRTHTYQGGRDDPGEHEIMANYVAADYVAAVALKSVAKSFRVLLADNTGVGFAGYVSEVTIEVDGEGLDTIALKIQQSGASAAFVYVP